MKKITKTTEAAQTRELNTTEMEGVSGGLVVKKGPAPGPGGTDSILARTSFNYSAPTVSYSYYW